MNRPRALGAGIAALSLLLGFLFLQTMSLRAAPTDQPYVETLSFALSTPAGLVLLAYLTTVFDFGAYFTERSPAGLFGDFLLSVLAAAAVGVPVTAMVVEAMPGRTILFVVASFGTFLGGFGCFLWRASDYFEFDPDAD